MKKIPVRYMDAGPKHPDDAERFSIRDLRDLLAGKNMVQELHRHEFFYLLILKKGTGAHEIDFTSYEVSAHTVYFLRPGQVHQLTLKAGSEGYVIAFNADFYYPHDKRSHQLLQKTSHVNYTPLDKKIFNKVWTVLTYIFQEYNNKPKCYHQDYTGQVLLRHHQRIYYPGV